jgi:hypothetical protein
MTKPPTPKLSHQLTTQIRANKVYPVLPRVLCVKGFSSSRKKKRTANGPPYL